MYFIVAKLRSIIKNENAPQRSFIKKAFAGTLVEEQSY
jgi:hypothetical protein